MELKPFIFIMRSPNGQEYEMAVPARRESDAERLLKNLLDALNSRDKILFLKASEGASGLIDAEERNPPTLQLG
ncbi:MAG: hypothetical protein A2010_16400 [Nitrospirae bacterium GWD2_57_9]|nr:MAG: hypothetical protein A2010_16400 [Nitrospirae bacterium GWD2_57_9]